MEVTEAKFYNYDCFLLEDRKATLKEFTGTGIPVGQFLEAGALSSSPNLAFNTCASCTTCIPCRIAVDRFEMNRSQKRSFKKNSDLSVIFSTETPNAHMLEQHADLFAKHKSARNLQPLGKEAKETEAKTIESKDRAFLKLKIENAKSSTLLFVEAHHANGNLAGAAVMRQDFPHIVLEHVYYETQNPNRSLGTFLILNCINSIEAIATYKEKKDSYLYLGTWMTDEKKRLHYKKMFNGPHHAFEILTKRGWKALDNVPPECRHRPDAFQQNAIRSILGTPVTW
ncbi:MAG: hypothetical protein KDI46_00340 [Alphaproteobacteria bacterium]|nr:hypothetical protein [Alphaproteobacteria bacterium]